MDDYSSITHRSRKVETTQESNDGWMDEHSAVYPCNGILFGHKKGWSSAACYNMSEPGNHYAK